MVMVVSVFIIMIVPMILGVMGAVLPAFGFFRLWAARRLALNLLPIFLPCQESIAPFY